MFKSLEEWLKTLAHVVQMSTKEQVQENNIWELGAKTQIPENWNLPDSLPD